MAATIKIIRTTPPGEGVARRTSRASAGARRLIAPFAVAVVDLPLGLVACGGTGTGQSFPASSFKAFSDGAK